MHMHMNFWWGTDVGDFFIKGFTINGSGQMISLCISLFVLSIASEGLKVSGLHVFHMQFHEKFSLSFRFIEHVQKRNSQGKTVDQLQTKTKYYFQAMEIANLEHHACMNFS